MRLRQFPGALLSDHTRVFTVVLKIGDFSANLPRHNHCVATAMQRLGFVFGALAGAALLGCGPGSGTYCQTGPKYGTQCYAEPDIAGPDPTRRRDEPPRKGEPPATPPPNQLNW